MPVVGRWPDRVITALDHLGSARDERALLVEVAVLFADRFEPEDRAYDADRPRWHRAVTAALQDLAADGAVVSRRGWHLTAQGSDLVASAHERISGEAPPAGDNAGEEDLPGSVPSLVSGVITPPLRSAQGRSDSGVAGAESAPMEVMIELNLVHRSGASGAFRRLAALWKRVTADRPVARLAEEYACGALTMGEMKRLVAADAVPIAWPDRAVYRIWPDFQVQRQIDATITTVKADAAQRSFNAAGQGIVWAVVDSGIQGDHPHFAGDHTLDDPSVADLHRTFTGPGDPTLDGALVDEDGHGTHVAGIIAGGLVHWKGTDEDVVVTESRYNVDNPTEPLRQPRALSDPRTRLVAMAPQAKLVSLKVLGGGGQLTCRVSRVIQALAYVREVNSVTSKIMRIHGVNLSLGYDFDPTWFACGRSPLCQEVDKLVRSGVVVVVAAGNSGFGTVNPTLSTVNKFGLGMTINDPGNAELAITVGSTHRDAPHAFGVSYFSSKGPTGDGRRKPDLVAPGERITSAAAGALRAAVAIAPTPHEPAVYVEESGTSMAAPHVSGVIAAFLSVRREYLGQPDLIKQIVVGAATPLGRDPYFQGAGLVDLMRALQSV